MDESNPTARALVCLQVLQDHPGITAARLAERLHVSDRAARRYVSVLREAGIPVESVRGPYGGYRLGRGLRLPPLVFNATEALGLVMAVLDGHHDASDPTGLVGGALGKIIRALPEQVAAQAEAVRRATAAAPDRAAARPDPATTSTLVQACSDRRRLRLGYRTESGSEWEVEVDPWAVVVRHGRWYLVCRSLRADAVRTYRVDRVHDVVAIEGDFEPPADLDPVALLEENLAVGWEYDTEVVVSAPLESVAWRLPRVLGRLEAVDEGTTRLVGSTNNPWWYAEQLAGLRAPYRIVGGPELQEAARTIGQGLLAATDVPGPDEGGSPLTRP